MRTANSFKEVYLHKNPVDMRKSINGLSLIVSEEMLMNPCDDGLFVFLSKKQTLMKCLYWDRSGFALWIKRLEKERFKWPKSFKATQLRFPQNRWNGYWLAST